MFCGECGAKNKKTDAFCQECGAPLTQEVKEEKNTTVQKVVKPRQPMSKKNKIIVAIIAVVVVVLGIGYKVLSDMTSPKSIAKDYIQATINQDGNKLYKYLELDGDKTFVSKKIFTELLKNSMGDTNVSNYKITDVEYGSNGLTAKVKFVYTMKDSSSEEDGYVSLVKEKGKKYLIFDNWKLADMSSSNMVVKDYKIQVAKGAKVTYAGIELTDKYMDKKSTDSNMDVYILPQVFTTTATLKAVLPSGFEIEENVTPSSYSNVHTVSFNEDNLTDDAKNKIIDKSKNVLMTLYESAISEKEFSEIKGSFEHNGVDLKKLEKSYSGFLSNMKSAYRTLTSIEFTDISIYDLELTDDGFLEVELSLNFDYSTKYTSWSDEVITDSDDDYDYVYLTFTYDNGEYYLVNFDSLQYYFY